MSISKYNFDYFAQGLNGTNKPINAAGTEQTPQTQQAEQPAKETADTTKTSATTKELESYFSAYNPYRSMGLNISPKKQSTIPDLCDITGFDVSSVSKADKLAAAAMAKEAGLGLLTEAYTWGPLSEGTKGGLSKFWDLLNS